MSHLRHRPVDREAVECYALYVKTSDGRTVIAARGTFVRGCRAIGPRYSHGGLPAEPDAIEDIEVAYGEDDDFSSDIPDVDLDKVESAMLEQLS